MANLFVATISAQSPRYPEWLKTFGTDSVPVTRFYPHLGTAPGHEHGAYFFQVDVARLSAEQRRAVVAFLSARFGVPPEEVQAGLDDPAQGLPVLAEDLFISVDARLLL